MKILLINHNPVVSRLTSLSAKKEKVELDEIKEISELVVNEYAIVFVDSESYNESVSNILQNSGIKTKVLFYAQGDEEDQSLFNHTILKPFLPSEVSAILREVKMESEQDEATKIKEEPSISDLVENKNNDLEELVPLKTEEKEHKEELLPIQLEVEEEKIEEKENIEEKPKEESAILNLDEDLFELDDKEDKNSLDQDDLFEVDKEIKEKIISDDILDLDLESQNEVNFDEKVIETLEEEKEIISKNTSQPQKETKILDEKEISGIKNLLNDENNLTDENLTLDDIITPTAPIIVDEPKNIEEPKKEKKKEKETPLIEDEKLPSSEEVLATTLSKLPTEELRKLLRGATVNITIQFPNDL